jgi:hypothetical protein
MDRLEFVFALFHFVFELKETVLTLWGLQDCDFLMRPTEWVLLLYFMVETLIPFHPTVSKEKLPLAFLICRCQAMVSFFHSFPLPTFVLTFTSQLMVLFLSKLFSERCEDSK